MSSLLGLPQQHFTQFYLLFTFYIQVNGNMKVMSNLLLIFMLNIYINDQTGLFVILSDTI